MELKEWELGDEGVEKAIQIAEAGDMFVTPIELYNAVATAAAVQIAGWLVPDSKTNRDDEIIHNAETLIEWAKEQK